MSGATKLRDMLDAEAVAEALADLVLTQGRDYQEFKGVEVQTFATYADIDSAFKDRAGLLVGRSRDGQVFRVTIEQFASNDAAGVKSGAIKVTPEQRAVLVRAVEFARDALNNSGQDAEGAMRFHALLDIVKAGAA